eukprot:6478004-Amphidinium_carterae.1
MVVRSCPAGNGYTLFWQYAHMYVRSLPTGVVSDTTHCGFEGTQKRQSLTMCFAQAFGLLCGMARASLTTRQALWHGDSGSHIMACRSLHDVAFPPL